MKSIRLVQIAACVLLGCTFLSASASSEQGIQPAQQPAANISKVNLSQFAWLEGKWEGNWGPRLAEQVWLGARAGEMPGLFRVAENDKTLVLELYSLIETSDGVELRLRHFTPTLIPWEQSAIAILRLTAFDNTAVFENISDSQPYKQSFIRIDPETFIARTQITAGNENSQIAEIRFHRVVPAAVEAPSTKKKKSK